MTGSPVIPARRVTLADWQDPPRNRWAFQHVGELIPMARIARGDGPVSRLSTAPRPLDGLRFRVGRRSMTIERMLEETWTDGWLVVHRGRVVAETYRNGLSPATTHLLMSISKSLTATLAGALVGAGRLDIDAEVPSLVPELRGSSFDGCSVRDLLDMRSGTRFDEDYDDLEADVRVYEQVWGWRPRTRSDLPEDGYAYMRGLTNARPHGGPFEYRSVLTDVLGWVLEKVGGARFAELFSRLVWVPLGAEHDAGITVDPHGCSLPDGGICTTLRDLGRVGVLHLQDGRIGGHRVLPSGWVHAVLDPAPDLRAAFEGSPDASEFSDFPDARYHLQWWVLDPRRGIFAGAGINGQQLLIHRPSRTVVAKLSTWPVAWDADLARLQRAGAIAVAEALADGRV
jgi:CubicO group peptidase (beta-lactamase class C family)